MEGHMLSDSIYTKFPEQANPQRQKAAWWLPGTDQKEQGGITD